MHKKANFYLDNPDIQFHVERKAEYGVIFDLVGAADREALGVSTVEEYARLWRDSLIQIGEIAGGPIAANQRIAASTKLRIEGGEVVFPEVITKNIELITAAGMSGLGIPARFGGIPSPIVAELPIVEILYRACPSTYLNVTWFSPIARVISEYGTEDQKQRVLPRIATGEWSGNMALTEPDAGSDLGALRTYSEKQPDGTFKLYGSKRFISNGCGMVSLVLARQKQGENGLSSLSLFLCLRKNAGGANNYEVTKLEEKPGLHGSPTCELQYEGSVAEIIGEEGKGFTYMLHLMNEARIGVSIQGVGIMEAVLRMAKEYTATRKTWGRPIAEHELICEKLLDMEVSTYGIRSLSYQATNALTISQMASHRLRDDKNLTIEQTARYTELHKTYTRLLRRWTPLVKYYAGEQVCYNARECMQMHGGYGYTLEYLPEWWLRESLIVPSSPLRARTSRLDAVNSRSSSLRSSPSPIAMLAMPPAEPMRRCTT